MNATSLLGSLVLTFWTTSSLWALPTMDLVTAGSFANNPAAIQDVKILRDDQNKNLHYIVPHKLKVVRDSSKNPLFRMSVNPDGTGDIYLIAKLVPHRNTSQATQQILLENPAAEFAFLPLSAGLFKVSIKSDEIYQTIASSTVTHNASASSQMPLHARVSAEGMERLRLISSTRTGSLLVFGYEFNFLSKQIGDSYDFKIHKNNLLEQIQGDEKFQEALATGSSLDTDWARSQVFRAIGFNFQNGKSIIPLNDLSQDPNYLYVANQILQNSLGNLFLPDLEKNWLQASALLSLSRVRLTSEEVLEISRSPAAHTVLAQAQVSGSLRGACLNYASLIYNYWGASSCSAMIPGGNDTGEGGEEGGVFDPILGR